MSVFPRGSIYYYEFVLKGKRYAGSTFKRGKREASAFEHEKRKEVMGFSEPAADPSRMTLAQAIDRCYEERWSQTASGDETRSRMLTVSEILGGDTLLSTITGAKVSLLVSKLREMHLGKATINRYRAHLKTLLNMAYREWQVIPAVPVIKLEKEIEGRTRYFTLEEENAILDLLRTGTPKKNGFAFNPYPEAADLFVILSDTGMRLNNGMNLRSVDVNFDTNRIVLPGAVTKGGNTYGIPMTERVRAILWERREQDRMFKFHCIDELERIWRRRVRKELPFTADATIHTFRHSCASRLIQAGIPLFNVGEMLGHQNLKTTKRYSHLRPESLMDAADVLNNDRSGVGTGVGTVLGLESENLPPEQCRVGVNG